MQAVVLPGGEEEREREREHQKRRKSEEAAHGAGRAQADILKRQCHRISPGKAGMMSHKGSMMSYKASMMLSCERLCQLLEVLYGCKI